MKNFLYGAIAIAILGLGCMFGYYLYNKAQIESIQFIQEQQKLCEEKYSSRLGVYGDHRYNSKEFSKTEAEIKYIKEEKACYKRYKYQYYNASNGKDYDESIIYIENLDNGSIIFHCSENSNDGAKCSIGCKEKEMKSCYGNISDDDNESTQRKKLTESDYIKTMKQLGFTSDESLNLITTLNEIYTPEKN